MRMVAKPGRLIAGAAGVLVLLAVMGVAVDLIAATARTPRLVQEVLVGAELRARDLSAWQRRALLAVEDPNFDAHHGIDLTTPGAGLTTITQGIAKKLYVHPFKPGWRKLRLMLLARWVLDPLVSKEDQLTLFLNLMYFGRHEGRPVSGLAAAARAYYHQSVAQLTPREYLSLVAMIIAPVNFHVLQKPEANRERTRRLEQVVSGHYRPKHLMDLYYGPLNTEDRPGLAPASYFPSVYKTPETGGGSSGEGKRP